MKHSLDKLREQLLGDEQVQQMIRARAYEIYELRGGQPGREAQDWLRAEREVLAFLIAGESTRAEERESRSSPAETVSAIGQPTGAPTKRRSRGASGPKKGSTKRVASKKTPAAKAKPKRNRITPDAAEKK